MICIIPARGGSQRIPRKNIQPFHGKPIIAYSIELGRETCSRVIVSTEDPEISMIAKEFGAEVLERPPVLAHDEIGTQEVVGHTCGEIPLESLPRDERTVCCLYATSPLLTSGDIAVAQHVMSTTRNECVYSIDAHGDPSGGFYIADASFFIKQLDPYEESSFVIQTADIDINTHEDWERAEKLYEEIHGH